MNQLLKDLQNLGTDVPGALARFVNNESLYIKFLSRFLQDTNMQQLQQAVADEDYEEAFKNSHTLKGVTGNLGLNSIYLPLIPYVELLRDYETNDFKRDAAVEDLSVITEAYEHVCSVIHKYLD